MSVPDYVHCVQVNKLDKPTKTWCGRESSADEEWLFVDANHAILNALKEGYLLICQACAKSMKETIDKGTYS